MLNHIRIATRKSPLALVQAFMVKSSLESSYPKLKVSVLPMSTQGDDLLNISLAAVGGKGLFIKELEHALLMGKADIAVHSMKDIPMDSIDELVCDCVLQRGAVEDVFLSHSYDSVEQLPKGAVIGTSSLRRWVQLHSMRTDLIIKPLRGNLQTRIDKLYQKKYDAIVLAYAGLERLNFKRYIRSVFTIKEILPAANQGIIGIQYHRDNVNLKNMLSAINDDDTLLSLKTERHLIQLLGGDCHAPIGALCTLKPNNQLELRGLVGRTEPHKIIKAQAVGAVPETVASVVAEQLIKSGAKALLKERQ